MSAPFTRDAARRFVVAAFDVLVADNAIPTSSGHRRVQAHIDFDASRLEQLPEYSALTHAIGTEFSAAFEPGEDDDRGRQLTLSLWIHSFLEHCIYLCSMHATYGVDGGTPYDPHGSPVGEAIDELVSVLAGASYNFVVARVVSHLTTDNSATIQIGDITIEPDNLMLDARIRRLIPDAEHAWKRRPPRVFRPPNSLVVATATVTSPESHSDRELRTKLDRFVLAVCLLTGATAQPTYEVAGASTPITRWPARLSMLIDDKRPSVVRRVVRLTGTEGAAIDALTDLLAQTEVKRPDAVKNSLSVAIRKFSQLDTTTDPFDQLVDLATGLEAAVLGGSKETEGLTLRLRSRVAALLSAADDPATVLFRDIGELYGLRSKIVHGGDLTVRQLTRAVNAISTVPTQADQDNSLVRLGFANDRLRDILRRAILARLCLAAEPDPLWPLKGADSISVDPLLADDATRTAWRARWRDRLDSFGIAPAAARASAGEYALTPYDD
ncbi:hypothetical protein IU470_18710 [Nocardia abscessus]|uniref:Apea-like HEPN domain-containing protein n=1 Tax=Nocardia abscessus TaxID=120957 RepID=A0ABS0CET5_9NOCA|nr:HEPN domain-containing protein [Nocardia abscessus]MBF6227129.1 hypothetical protein [Nocardia abscessus]